MLVFGVDGLLPCWLWPLKTGLQLLFSCFKSVFIRINHYFSMILSDCTEFEETWLGFTACWRLYWVLLGFTGFYRVLPGFTGFLLGFYWVLLGFTRMYHITCNRSTKSIPFYKLIRVLLGFTRFYRVLLGFYWVLLGFTGFYWVLLGFTRMYHITCYRSTKSTIFLRYAVL